MDNKLKNILDEIPIQDIEDYMTCRQLKNEAVKNQNYEEASRLRDWEKDLINKNRILWDIFPFPNQYTIISYIRDRKINEVIND